MTKLTLYIFLFLLTQSWSLHSYAKGTYLEPEKFLSDVFNNNPPNPKKLWLKKELKKEIKKYWEMNSSHYDFDIGMMGLKKPVF